MAFSYEKSAREGCNSIEMQIMDGNRVLAYAMNQYNAERIVAKLNELLGHKPVSKREIDAEDLTKQLYTELKGCVKLTQKHGTEPQHNKVVATIKRAELYWKKAKHDEQ